MKILLLSLLTLTLVGCNHTPIRSPDVIEKPLTCYPLPAKPKLTEVEIELKQLLNGEWAITIDDENFNIILSNQVLVDTYIQNSYNTLKSYEKQCNDPLDR